MNNTYTDSQLATAPVAPGFHRATTALSEVLGVEPRMMIDTIKKQCFPSMSADSISDAQLAAFISVANTMGLNPLVPGMLFAYPSKNGGIVPVTGPDGVLKKLDEERAANKIDGYECKVFPEDVTLPPTHAVCTIHLTDKKIPATFTAIFKEWVVTSNPNWNARPRHMIWLRAIKQCARQVIHGVPYDEDDVKIGEMVNVTPSTEAPPQPERPAPPPRAKKGAAVAQEAVAAKPATTPVTVEAEVVPPAPAPKEDPAPAKVEPVVVKPEPVAEPAKPEPAKVDAPKGPATALKDGETGTFNVTINKLYTMWVTLKGEKHATIQAEVSGDFDGKVYHFGGAKQDGEVLVPAIKAWGEGNRVKLALVGQLFPKQGKVLCVVEKIEEAQPASPDAEFE